MVISVEYFEDSDIDWDNRLLNHAGSFYQTTVYAEYLKKSLGMKIYYVYFKENGLLISQIMIHIGPRFAKYLKSRHNFLFNLFSKYFKTCYIIRGPTILNQCVRLDVYRSLLSFLEDLAKKEGFFSAQDISLPLSEDPLVYKCFYDFGFYSDPWGTVVIDTTQSEDDLWKKLVKSRRNIVRRGLFQGLVMREAKSEGDYDFVISMIQDMSKRNKVFFHPIEYYKTLFNVLSSKGMLKTFFVEHEGAPVATVSVYLFNKQAIQTLVAHTEYSLRKKISGTDFLEWNIIKWCHDNGYQTYDLAGIRPESLNEKDISLREFKMRWGGQVLTYPYFSKYYSAFKSKFIKLLIKNKNKFI
jgi:hypothetical protein